MTFQPIVPATGILGYKLLTSTQAAQREVFDRQPAIARDVEHFTTNIKSVTTAADLVSDRKLLRVALGAFGLDAEIDKKAFIQKLLESDTGDPESFANKLVDPRYKRFVAAFNFNSIGGPRTGFSSFPQEITSAYTERQFEIAVGEQDESLRLAMNFKREIETYANSAKPDSTAWLSVMGDTPMRKVFETVFGFSASFGTLDLDRQRDDLRAANDRVFGDTSLAVFKDPAVVDEAINRFMAQRAIQEGPNFNTPGFAALSLFGGGFGSNGVQNLILSSAR